MNTPSPPLWRQLQAVAGALAAILAGVSGTAAVDAVEPELRPGVQALLFQVLRQLGRAQALRRQLAARPPPSATHALLCTALGLMWNESDAPYDPHTLVNQAVEAARRSPQTQAQAGFINACLRRFLRERAALVARTAQDPVAYWNHPAWWIEHLALDYPDRWQEILRANNRQAPMSLRVNIRRSTRDQYLERLRPFDPQAQPAGDFGVTLSRARLVHDIPGFDDGVVSVQDPAAQLAAPLLLPPGSVRAADFRVLDACAAPGGKTAHLLELHDCEVTALDLDAGRCERIRQNLARLKLQARVVAGDALLPDAWWDGRPFDAVLLDAPCTASGIVRRHPDVRWLRRASDVAQLGGLQAALLGRLWGLLKPGGRLLYSTCSVFRAEGAGQMQTFLAHHTDAFLQSSPGHLVPQGGANGDSVPDNGVGDHDGFYYALLEKRTA